MKYFPCEWDEDPERYIYLGSEKNPRTRKPYDYYLVHTNTSGKISWDYSPTCRHGVSPEEYGSGPLSVAHYDNTHIDHKVDLCYGIYRAQQLSMYYLATGEKPLLEYEL